MTEERALLQEIIAATERVADSLRLSVEEVSRFAPVPPDALDRMPRSQQKDVLSLFKSYEQLVDLLANRLVRAMLVLDGQNTAGWSARDAFRHMEARGSLEDAQRFMALVLLRNRLAHEYPMRAEKRAQRINETLDFAASLLETAERLLMSARAMLASGEPGTGDPLEALAATIPDDLWVWGPEPDRIVLWLPKSSPASGGRHTAPRMSEDAFRSAYADSLALRLRAFGAWAELNPDVRDIGEVMAEAFPNADSGDYHDIAKYIAQWVDIELLIGEWRYYEKDLSWPIVLRSATKADVQMLRDSVTDDPDLGSLIEFWGRGPAER